MKQTYFKRCIGKSGIHMHPMGYIVIGCFEPKFSQNNLSSIPVILTGWLFTGFRRHGAETPRGWKLKTDQNLAKALGTSLVGHYQL